MATDEVYLLVLDESGTPDVNGTYIRLPPPLKPYTLRFQIEGTSSITRQGSLWVNIPEHGKEFHRENFREYKLAPDFSRALTIDIPIYTAGVYAFYSEYSKLPEWNPLSKAEANGDNGDQTRTPTFYICVSPVLAINGKPLELDGLALISAVSKWMGPLSNWEPQLARISDRGYNMVHFTPMMWRGESNSPYSIFSQLDFDPYIFPQGRHGIEVVSELVDKMEKKYNTLALTDIVWNHTANNTLWLHDHPEAGYNLKTAPWLESAYELDTSLLNFSKNLSRLGFPTELKKPADLFEVMEGIKAHCIGATRLWEYYVIDTERDTDAALLAWGAKKWKKIDIDPNLSFQKKALQLSEKGLTGTDRLGQRYRRTIDPEVAAGFIYSLFGEPPADDDEYDEKEAKVRTEIAKYLDEVNLALYKEYDTDAEEILEQLFNRIKYVRLDDHGPKQGPINAYSPLIETYFTRLPTNKRTSKFEKGELALANNGWIWNADPMVDFAGPASRAYLRREVIVWGDCVKLRYGKGPEDSLYLWQHMQKYTELMATIFHGFRIDNCHSTPIHVAEYLLDCARRKRPDLYVAAELFSGSEAKDYIFIQRLGINSLIREAMQAWGPGELSRLVHKHGGKPVGSFEQDHVKSESTGQGVRRVTASIIHALFADCTHDNETPAQKRVPEDTLPNGALVSMCSCATGSVMGYDDINPKLLDVVNETRYYNTDDAALRDHGIGWVKKILNNIHVEMGNKGYNETHVHHEGEYITVHRVHPKTREGYFLIAHTAFSGGTHRGDFNPVYLTDTKVEPILSVKLTVSNTENDRVNVFNDPEQIRGLPSKTVNLSPPAIRDEGNNTVVTVPDEFPPGSIILLKTWIPTLDTSLDLDSLAVKDADQAFQNVSLTDLNFILYRCDSEERDLSNGEIGVYNIPDFGPLVYAGLQGWWSILKGVIRNNDLGHPICQHLRSGTWALDYCVTRLEKLADKGFEGLRAPAAWLKERFEKVKKLPNFLVPRYFALVIQAAYDAAYDRAIELMGGNIKNGHEFVKSLAMVSIQMTGYMDSASLSPFKQTPCMAAGLPHFSSSYMRCWGRDIFISLRGLLIATRRYDAAKEHIVAFASVVKHGMIPNLLASGTKPRYNSRDSVWFFLQNIQDYTKLAPNGLSILEEKVKRRFLPFDDTYFVHDDPRAYSKESTIGEVIFECLQRHASGMSFREANAGPDLDSQMKWEGFQIDIQTDWKTGIIFGGSQWNCGTWMDKMGESERAGNKGVPGTPRDGAPVEITGLHYSALKWLDLLYKQGKIQWKGVEPTPGKVISWEAWAEKIKQNFEKCYYVPLDKGDDSWYDVNPKVVNRRGIYKDLYRSGKEYEDYQLRPNFPIAMTVAPDLFDPEHALGALKIADGALRGPTGMATLDPIDLNYRPFYINWDDNDDFATSKGRNYHQGPEWLWPTGFFLRAFLHFDLLRKKSPSERTETFQQIHRRIQKCKEMINESPWAGLTELTQKDGAFCGDSCPTQAWSASCLIDLFQDAAEVVASQS
ncbi:4-alpha-glucanotransferase [Dactylella cylindrospora]|nr:4-alpha-glucanotransferase [Dactylella cylindrospora]